MMFLYRYTDSFNANVSKFLLKLVKLALWFGALSYIIYRLVYFSGEHFDNWTAAVQPGRMVFLMLLFVCLLSIVNWSLESFKWQMLAGKLQKLSFVRSFKGVLIGVAMGMITPKRLGELAGRAIVLDKKNMVKGAVINVAGTICQLFVTVAAGIISMFFLFHTENIDFAPFFSFNGGLAIILIVFLLMAVIIYVFWSSILKWMLNFAWFNSLYGKLFVLREVSNPELLSLLFLSLLRYVVFMLQCFLLFSLAGLKLSFPEVFLFQSVVFLLMTVLPVTALSELAVKSGVAIMAFSHIFAGSIAGYQGYEVSLVIANGLLWLINLAIPALVGVIWGMEYPRSIYCSKTIIK